MSLKDLFDKTADKIVTNSELQDLYNQAESEGYLEEVVKDKNRFLPPINFTNPENFARYGSAERYYVDAIKNIYQRYPYDGSKKEKEEWKNNSSQFDIYMFDNIYPKTTGYVFLSGTNVSVSSNIRSSSLPQYISVKGGPNAGPNNKFDTGNIYDLTNNRESNLGITEYGNTVEFWFKDSVESGSVLSQAEYCLFDLWNGVNSGSNNYTRLTIKKDHSTTDNNFSVSYISGTSGLNLTTINYNFDPYNWHHYAFSFRNSVENLSNLEVCLFVDGNLVLKNVYNNSGNIKLANNSELEAYIGCYRADSSGVSGIYNTLGVSCGYYDEFRFWKECRSSQQIYRNWYNSVGGGSNTDDSNTELGIYYKFNEGIINSSSINDIDKIVLDYSGRISNGLINNYSIICRNTASAIDIYFNKSTEHKDPIIYSSNALVSNVLEEYTISGSIYDEENASSIYKSLPSWILEEAETKDLQDLSNLIQIISSYFDSLHIQIENLPNIKFTEYTKTSDKPKPFINQILSSYGFETTDLFNEATFIEEILSKNENKNFDDKLSNVKNFIYENIYNNLSHIYKSKGTEESLRNLIRCFGVDDELVKINLYANNTEYEIKDKYIYASRPKKFIDFNDSERYSSTIFQKNIAGDASTISFLPFSLKNTEIYNVISSSYPYLYNIPTTLEAEIIFPKKITTDFTNYSYANFTEVSLFGIHTAKDSNIDLSWGSNKYNFQVYAIKRSIESKDVYFKLTGSFDGYGVELTSSWYNDVYDDNKWNFAVRFSKENLYEAFTVTGSDKSDYVIEFVGYNTLLDTEQSISFNLSASIPRIQAEASLAFNKRIYAGAHLQDFTGDVLQKTDIKISQVRYWLDYLTNEEIKTHAYDIENYGIKNSTWTPHYLNQEAYVTTNDISASVNTFTKADTLTLNWNFSNITSSDSSGQFIISDFSSGSTQTVLIAGYDWLSRMTRSKFTGVGYNFPSNDTSCVKNEYFYTAKIQSFETLNGSDLIFIPDVEDVTREKNSKPISYYISLEKSMSEVINNEILNWFSTIKDFSNLIGEPVDRYKQEYSKLKNLRKFFYSKVSNTPDFEKFFDFYKWIDSSISQMVSQLLPLSANASDKVRNIVENTLLQRNKYENKLSTIEFKGEIISLAVSNGINFSYSLHKAPTSPAGTLWLKQRVNRTISGLVGDEYVNTPLEPQNDIDREVIRQVINHTNANAIPTFYNKDTNTFYQSKNDLIKIFNKPYIFLTEKLLVVENAIKPAEILKSKANTEFVFASASVTASGQVVQPVKKTNLYNKTYEFLQGSGRITNNKSFIDLQGLVSSSARAAIVSGINLGFHDRTLPSRSINDSIIVERFSAPGGPESLSRGALDQEAEEYSAYNSINYRNYKVRKNLNSWLAESSSIDNEYPSYHKTPKNPAYHPISSGSTAVSADYDNYFITHQIPQSEIQYRWITASAITRPDASGFISEYDNLNVFNSNSLQINSGSFVSNARGFVDYTNLNTAILTEIDVSSSLITGVNIDSSLTNTYFLNLNGPYQYPSWKQIRVGLYKANRYFKKLNYITVQDKPVIEIREKDDGTNEEFIRKQALTFTKYKEPPVSFNKPIKHKLIVTGSVEPIEIISSYDNNKKYFNNVDLSTRLELSERKELQAHDIFKQLENGTYLPKAEILNSTYEQILFPKNEHITFKDIRYKDIYTEVSGFGNNGYDRNVANINTIWKDDISDRLRTNAIDADPSVPTISSSVNSLNIKDYKFYKPGASLTLYNSYLTRSAEYRFSDNIPGGAIAETPYAISKAAFLNVSKSLIDTYDTVWPLDNTSSVGYNLRTYHPFGTIVSGTNLFTISSSYVSDLAGGDDLFELVEYLKAPSSGSYKYTTKPIANIRDRLQQVEYFNYFESGSSWINYDSTRHYIPRPKPSLVNKVHMPATFFAGYVSGAYPDLGFYFYSNFIINEGFSYRTNIIAGKNPWYDSYDKYFENIKPISLKYSNVPEYKISDHMDFFIRDNKGQFKAIITGNYLNLYGTTNDFSDLNANYNNTEIVDTFIYDDVNKGNKKLTLNINGIKKLLPYKGFYPSDRSLQLVDLFQKGFFGFEDYTYFENLENSNVDLSLFATSNQSGTTGGTPILQQMQTVLQPMFAPGILFNTIKSGIAVDWPVILKDKNFLPYSASLYAGNQIISSRNIYSNATSAYDPGITGYQLLISNDFTNRMPFESILDLKSAFSEDEINNKTLFYLDPTRLSVDVISGSERNRIRNPSYDLSNKNRKNQSSNFIDDRYNLAINNYLAEIPNFFLQNGQLNSFISKPGPYFLLPNKRYEMTIKLSKDDDLKMVLSDPSAEIEIYNFEYFRYGTEKVRIAEGSVFGPPSRYFVNADGSPEYFNSHRLYKDPAFAPYVPPYFYGERKLKIYLDVTKSSDIDTGRDWPLQEILDNLDFEETSDELENLFITSSTDVSEGTFYNTYSSSIAYKAKMPISASINFLGKTKVKDVQYDANGFPLIIAGDEDAWVIQTKFETPVLNFNNSNNLNQFQYVNFLTTSVTSTLSSYYESSYINYTSYHYNSYMKSSMLGMWSGYGSITTNESINFTLESPKTTAFGGTQSLADKLGFVTDTKKIGRLAQRKEISEALVLIPYTENYKNHDNSGKYATTIPEILGENNIYATTDRDRGIAPYYFGINKSLINNLLQLPFDNSNTTVDLIKKSIVTLSDNREVSQNSIYKTIKLMTEYNIPPHLDWVTYRDIQPFIMYIVEFKHVLDQQDLADIWQGVMPKIAITPELETVSFTHDLNANEFFEGKSLPPDIRWKVFKIKKKAKNNYYDLTLSSADDERFKFSFTNDASQPLEYSYNWPYDYFSLVELVNIEAKLDSGFNIGDKIDNIIKVDTTQLLKNIDGLTTRPIKNEFAKFAAEKLNKKLGNK